ncbi:MAG: Tungstate uptake system ATP-binding protein TupC [Alphaproteobacteria bacterium MarineAlpha4_Bin2]|nr:MAG: Tungstate uptake system ATP-binding protein TupC [Alphaproteobacteria bacterium MarineAlpha4_Bin2]
MHNPKSILPAEIRNLSYTTDGRQLIKNLDLDLQASGITAIMGPNGAGKSLLLRLLHGLIAPSSGEIRWAGKQLELSVRRRQAMVFQRPVMLRRSVAANVDFALKLQRKPDRSRRDEILAMVDLLQLSRQPARRLSGGEQQRLALARALVTEPEVLFLDEPAANLDPGATVAIETIVKRARDNGTKIVVITHDIGQARRLADDIVFMHRGKAIERSDAKFFFASPRTPEALRFLGGELVL